VDVACIDGSGATICEHVRKYFSGYPGIVGEPPIFWKFKSDIFPQGHHLVASAGKPGDCHYNVEGVPDGALWQIFENKQVSEFSICTNGDYRPVTEAEIIAFQTN
jgi:hypothetical protein